MTSCAKLRSPFSATILCSIFACLLHLCGVLASGTHQPFIGNDVYFAEQLKIQRLTNMTATLVYRDEDNVKGIDCNSCDQMIYWADQSDKIKRARPVTDGHVVPEVILENDLKYPKGLAVDWKGGNVYFTHAFVGPGVGRLEVITCDGKYRKVLASQLSAPGPVTLDLLRGYLYYVHNLRIWRRDLNGKNPQQIKTQDAWSSIDGLSIHMQTNTLYWSTGNVVYGKNLSDAASTGTVLIDDSRYRPTSLKVVGDTLYWINSGTLDDSGAVYSKKLSGSMEEKWLIDSPSPQDISSFMEIDQSYIESGCAVNKSGCAAFCFTVPASNNGGSLEDTAPECGCSTGLSLNSDGLGCPDVPNEFLLFSVRYVEPYRSEIRMLSLNKDSSDSYIDTLVPIPLEGVKVNFLAFDHINLDQRLYWTEIEPPAIRSAFLNGSSRETFLDRNLQRPEGLAIDPYGKNLYWVDSRLDRVMVARLDNSSVRRVLVNTGLDHPRGIVLDLKNGYMYWSDTGSSWGEPKIERARLDGSGREVLIENPSHAIKEPTNIAFDPLRNFLYWADIHHSREDIIQYNITARTAGVDLNVQSENIFALEVLGDYLYWFDDLESRINQVESKSYANAQSSLSANYLLTDINGIQEIFGVDRSVERLFTACDFSNGYCSDICVLAHVDDATCLCRDGSAQDPTDPKQCTGLLRKIAVVYEDFIEIHAIHQHMMSTFTLAIDRRIDTPGNVVVTTDVDFSENALYWINATDKCIYRMSLNGTASDDDVIVTSVVLCLRGNPSTLAVDWAGRNLYWGDSQNGIIEFSKLNGVGRTVLLQDISDGPKQIVLDALHGDLYWSSLTELKIYKTKMDPMRAQEAGVLEWAAKSNQPGETVAAMTFSYRHGTQTDSLFWIVTREASSLAGGATTTDCNTTSTMTTTIYQKKLDEEESNPETVKTVSGDEICGIMTSFEVFENEVYLGFSTGKIQSYEMKTHVTNPVIPKDQPIVEMRLIDKTKQPYTHTCGVNNGGCSQPDMLCLVSSSWEHSCQCPPDQVKSSSNACSSSHPGVILVSTPTSIYYLPVVPPSSDKEFLAVSRLPLGPFHNVSSASYDPHTESVFWIDRKLPTTGGSSFEGAEIHTASLDGSDPRVVSVLPNVNPLAMVYDWIGAQIFVTEKDGYQIGFVTTDGKAVDSLLTNAWNGDFAPRDIAFDQERNILYWRNSLSSIYKVDLLLPTEEPTLVVEHSSLEQVTFDRFSNSLLWLNKENSSIESFNLETGETTVIVEGFAKQTKGLTVSDSQIFWYNSTSRKVYTKKRDGEIEVYLSWAFSDITSFNFFNRYVGTPLPTELRCVSSDGERPCSHFCSSSLFDYDYECACPPGRNLNETTCSGPMCVGIERLCEDGNECGVYCDGTVDCFDKSDEKCKCSLMNEIQCGDLEDECYTSEEKCNGISNCPNEFDEKDCCDLLCNDLEGNPHCVKAQFVCDGMNDCESGLDEMNCSVQITPSPSPTPSTSLPPSPHVSVATIAVLTVTIVFVAVVIALFFGIAYKFFRTKRKNMLHRRGTEIPLATGSSLNGGLSPPLRSETGSEYSEVSFGTRSTMLGGMNNGNNLDGSLYGKKIPNPPPSLQQSVIMSDIEDDLDDDISAISRPDNFYEKAIPPAPNPSINFDEVSDGMSISVSQREYPDSISQCTQDSRMYGGGSAYYHHQLQQHRRHGNGSLVHYSNNGHGIHLQDQHLHHGQHQQQRYYPAHLVTSRNVPYLTHHAGGQGGPPPSLRGGGGDTESGGDSSSFTTATPPPPYNYYYDQPHPGSAHGHAQHHPRYYQGGGGGHAYHRNQQHFYHHHPHHPHSSHGHVLRHHPLDQICREEAEYALDDQSESAFSVSIAPTETETASAMCEDVQGAPPPSPVTECSSFFAPGRTVCTSPTSEDSLSDTCNSEPKDLDEEDSQ